MRICLLLLCLINSSVAADIKVYSVVLPYTGDIYRRADVEFNCGTGGSSNSFSRNFVLSVKRVNNGAVLTISFHGTGVRIVQPLKSNQSLQGGKLLKIDPLSGEIVDVLDVSFKGKVLQVSDLEPKYIYRLSYTIFDKSENLKIVPPSVQVQGRTVKVQKMERGDLKFTVPIFFSPGSHSLDKKARFTLDKLKNLVGLCEVKIIGYADSTKIVRSNVSSNQKLANLRAMAVKNYLER